MFYGGCDLVSHKVASEMLNISERQLSRWVNRGWVEKTCIGGKVFYEMSEIERLNKAQEEGVPIGDLEKRKYWIEPENELPRCPDCEFEASFDEVLHEVWCSPYCPNCGARLRRKM